MDFEEIKVQMDMAVIDIQVPSSISEIRDNYTIVYQLKRRMTAEVVSIIFCYILLLLAPLYYNIELIPKSLYQCLLFLSLLIILGCFYRMIIFLKRKIQFKDNCRATLTSFIHELELIIEVYQTASVASLIILPMAVIVLKLGSLEHAEMFNQLITLSIPLPLILAFIITYFLLAIIIYLITTKWCEFLYGRYIREMKNNLNELVN